MCQPVPRGIPHPLDARSTARSRYDRETARVIVEKCTAIGESAEDNGDLFEGFSVDDAAAVALYTYDFGPEFFESNPYRLLNKALIGTTNEDLKKVRGMLSVIMSALRKLPRGTGKCFTEV